MPIPGYPRYYASKSGKIYSDITKKLLIQHSNGNAGYLYVPTGKKCHSKTLLVHRGVGTAWLIPPATCSKIENVYEDAFEYQINHISEDKHDCKLSNLEYTTASENINYGKRNSKVSQKLENNKNAVGHHYNSNAPTSNSFYYKCDEKDFRLGELSTYLKCSPSAITEAFRIRKRDDDTVKVKGKIVKRINKKI